nr:Hydroxymethylpyrimidine ABC transporter, substrate-binding component [Kibdelosporangium sp. MJ126-NF4]CTQ99040.1 Hydroxymethylpyrimidine ABC transporter, substrate-binding component [Kibdelosporangium sp. MJ126-NF4]
MLGFPIRRTTTCLALACALSSVAACGTATPAGEGGLLKIRVSNPANVSNVPLHLAMEQGYFREEGIEIEADVDLGAGSTVEAVAGGQVDMAWTNTVSATGVYAKGLGVRMVAPTDIAVVDSQQVLVGRGSIARSLADLKGKKIAVLSPNTICVLSVRTELKRLGLSQDSVAFTPVAPPEHANVLSGGEVGATCTSDPFRTLMIEQLGARPVMDASINEVAGYVVGGYVVSERYASQHVDKLAAFQRALFRATAYANAHPQEVRAALPRFTTVKQDVADRVIINDYVEAGDAELVRTKMQKLADVMLEYGMLEKPVTAADFLFKG